MNLPPFYQNQRVVYITGKVMPAGTVCVAERCIRLSCGCWGVHIGLYKSEGTFCPNHQTAVEGYRGHEKLFSPKSFRPLQEQTAPLIKLSQIQEKEKEKADPLILIEN